VSEWNRLHSLTLVATRPIRFAYDEKPERETPNSIFWAIALSLAFAHWRLKFAAPDMAFSPFLFTLAFEHWRLRFAAR
jgi:hypothetical protein